MDLFLFDHEVQVTFDYDPKEEQTLNYPGAHSSMTINEVLYKGVDIKWILEESDLVQLAEDCLIKFEEQEVQGE